MSTIPTSTVLERWHPGSQPHPWTWDDEERELLSHVCLCCGEPGHYQLQLEAALAQTGITQGIYLGPDGRVWDGHHRVVAARRLGVAELPLEDGSCR